ncbi:MAG: PA domain-containing protein [Flavobacteriales bacterium]
MRKLFGLVGFLLALIPGYGQQLVTPMDFIVNSPGNISGEYSYGHPVDFGPTHLSSTVTGDLEWAFTSSGDSLACSTVTTDLTGKVALVRRGDCQFTIKIYEAQLQGAIGCIVIDNTDGNSMNMLGGPNADLITIPSIFLSFDDGQLLTDEMDQGNSVNVSFVPRNLDSPRLTYAYSTPLDQVIPLNNMAVNILNNDVTTASNVNVKLSIVDPSGDVISFTESISTIPPLSETLVYFEGTYTPTIIGSYEGIYWSSINPTESLVVPFEITQDLFSLDNNDLTNLSWIGMNDDDFAIGGYRQDQGAAYITGPNGFSGESVEGTFALANADAFEGETFSMLLYKPNGTLTGNETSYDAFTVVGTASHTISPSDAAVPNTLISETLIDVATGGVLSALEPSTQYLLVVSYDGDGAVLESPKHSFTHQQEFLSIGSVVYADQLYLGGFTGYYAPIIRLGLDYGCLGEPTTTTDTHVACDSFTWIDGITYTESNNMASFNLSSVEGCDSLILLDLTINNSVYFEQVLTECPGTPVTVGASTYTSSGVYTDTFTSVTGCDSIVTTDLTYFSEEAAVFDLSIQLLSQSNGAQYQWLDCENENAPIPGETGQLFSPSTNGSYALEVQENGCTTTSACYDITGLGCTYADASNYDAAAISDDGSCIFDSSSDDACNAADIDGSGAVNTADLLELLSSFGVICE